MLDSNADLHTIGCRCFVQCNGARVAFAEAVWGEFLGLEERQRERFKRIMELWCEGKALTPEMMNRNEGRSSNGIRIEAFKAFKVRLYGFDVNFQKIRTFFIVIIDPAKKQNKADKTILRSAKARSDDLYGRISV